MVAHTFLLFCLYKQTCHKTHTVKPLSHHPKYSGLLLVDPAITRDKWVVWKGYDPGIVQCLLSRVWPGIAVWKGYHWLQWSGAQTRVWQRRCIHSLICVYSVEILPYLGLQKYNRVVIKYPFLVNLASKLQKTECIHRLGLL